MKKQDMNLWRLIAFLLMMAVALSAAPPVAFAADPVPVENTLHIKDGKLVALRRYSASVDALCEVDERVMEAQMEVGDDNIQFALINPDYPTDRINLSKTTESGVERISFALPLSAVGKKYYLAYIIEGWPVFVSNNWAVVQAPHKGLGELTVDLGEGTAYLPNDNILSTTLDALVDCGRILHPEGTTLYDMDKNGQGDISYHWGWDPEKDQAAMLMEKMPYCSLHAKYKFSLPEDHKLILDANNGIYAYYDTIWIDFSDRMNLAGAINVTFGDDPYPCYTGSVQQPVPVVRYGDKLLQEGKDYTCSWDKTPKDAGEYLCTIQGVGAYCGKETWSYEIHAIWLETSSENMSLKEKSFVYTGKAIKPTVILKTDSGQLVKSGSSYTLKYKNNKNAGTATVTLTGDGKNINGHFSLTFTIEKAANPMTVKAKTAAVKAAAVEKNAQKLAVSKVLTVKKAQGKVTYKKVSGDAKITVNKSTGQVTLKKGLPKGSYKVKVKVSAKGNTNYKSGDKTVTLTIKVK